MAIKRTAVMEILIYFAEIIFFFIMMSRSELDFSKLPILGAYGPFAAFTLFFVGKQLINLVEFIRMRILMKHDKKENEILDSVPWSILMLLLLLIMYESVALTDVFFCGFANPLWFLFMGEILTLSHLVIYRIEVKKRSSHLRFVEQVKPKNVKPKNGLLDYFRIDVDEDQEADDNELNDNHMKNKKDEQNLYDDNERK